MSNEPLNGRPVSKNRCSFAQIPYVAAAITCCVLEVVATLPEEVTYVWPSDWSLMKVFYFFNKYSPLVDAVLLVLVDMISRDSDACALQFQLFTYWFTVGALCSELIIVARTYALWGCERAILYFSLFVISIMTPHIFFVVQDMLRSNSDSFAANEPIIHAFGCIVAIDNLSCWPSYVYLMLAEFMIILLTLLKRYLDPVELDTKSHSNIILYTLYRDGTWFWAIVLVFSIVNLLVMFLAPRELNFSMQQSLRTIHSALCTRVLLNLRKAAACASSAGTSEFTVTITLAFESLPMFAPYDEEELEETILSEVDGMP